MANSEGTLQEETELSPESSTGEATANVSPEAESSTEATEAEPSTGEETAADVGTDAEKRGLQEAEKKGLTDDYQIEGEKAGAADYQTRLEEFDNVETPVPVVSLPVQTPSSEKSGEA